MPNLPPPPPESLILTAKDSEGSHLTLELRWDANEDDVLHAFTSMWTFLGYYPSEIVKGE